jgi:hypothetical protein
MTGRIGSDGEGKRTRGALLVLALLSALWAPGALGADTGTEPPRGGDGPPAELEKALTGLGWDAAALREVGRLGLDWGPFRQRDVDLLEEALRYTLEAGGPLEVAEQARVALEICRALREMEALGYPGTDMGRAVFAGLRAGLPEISPSRGGKGEGSAGERFRNRFRQEIRVMAGRRTRARAREGVRGGGPDGAGPPAGPGRPGVLPGRS